MLRAIESLIEYSGEHVNRDERGHKTAGIDYVARRFCKRRAALHEFSEEIAHLGSYNATSRIFFLESVPKEDALRAFTGAGNTEKCDRDRTHTRSVQFRIIPAAGNAVLVDFATLAFFLYAR